ncbi:hypothetical protein KsCSTR_30660 [Candidatus Kuenenia stuttgartiensis]|uniref:Uncharacterized protein n=1 Tax=Kuenenia stuttgartiensis TaxID=174633 RepID=A0A6G7GSG0_KUEST|nr:hypothetical protein KsCSTR_30660 [Candidatus Kuenenia stuttgartiensis]
MGLSSYDVVLLSMSHGRHGRSLPHCYYPDAPGRTTGCS